jgi:hypothetical protein
MPALEPHEELKLLWELELMSVTIDKTRLDIERIRSDIEDSRKRWDKTMHGVRMDEKRFVAQVAGMVITAIVVVVAAFAAGATWWNFFHTH